MQFHVSSFVVLPNPKVVMTVFELLFTVLFPPNINSYPDSVRLYQKYSTIREALLSSSTVALH